ncbi:uncharacterized protein LOC100036870 [Xenopus laevis]|uniref:LOC100036870 protein n=1 Tax=Xenopus laevis TaxID=8355 RepID=A1L2K0_XENLA|nr:uncharacterized protein LOC100036870 [Xenopus laevis]AAI29567.1 LOC100036870 protein [Xenopus laevis]
MALVRTGPSLCGGTLIKDNWVLTAAACKVDKTTTVDLGVHSIKTMNKLRQQFKVVRSAPHQKFDQRSYANNLQLLQLSGKANFSYAVNVLPLPSKYKDIKPGTLCQTAGWGITAYNGKQRSDKLMEVSLTVLDRMKCKDQWKSKIKVTKDMICTSDKGKRGFCNGDSGGPLICNRIFTGVVSFGPLICGMENGANVYTRLTSDYIKWIKKETKKRI